MSLLLPRSSVKKVLPSPLSSATVLSKAAASTTYAPSPLLTNTGVATRRSVDGFATALVHASPLVLVLDFLDASGPLFLLGSVSSTGIKGSRSVVLRVGRVVAEKAAIEKRGGVQTRPWLRGASWKTAAKTPEPEVVDKDLAPCVLGRVGEREFHVLTFRRPHTVHSQTGREVLIKLVHRVVLVEGDKNEGGGATVVYFETVEEKTLAQEGRDIIAGRRERTEAHFHVVTGKQQGYIMMVSGEDDGGTEQSSTALTRPPARFSLPARSLTNHYISLSSPSSRPPPLPHPRSRHFRLRTSLVARESS
jgi:hypothetical protein